MVKIVENCCEEVIRQIKEADKILIGFGAEWKIPAVESLFCAQEQWKASLEFQQRYWAVDAKKEGNAGEKEEAESDKVDIERIRIGYQRIKELVKEKDYFLITTNVDAYLYQQGFEEERIVAPCGDIRRLQCDDFEHGTWEFYREEEKICPICGKVGKLNVLQNLPYQESGYLEAWERYQIWIQGAMNRKIVILELGEGFQTPTVMRWPFEKLVFFQEKAMLYCVHKSLSMVSEKIGECACSIAENSVDFINRLG